MTNMEELFTYTGFDKVSKVKQDNDSLCYAYGYDRQRISMVEHVGNTVRTKRYVGNCEHVTESDGTSTTEYTVTYLTGPYGVFGAVKSGNGSEDMYYILKDNLGSWTTITDKEGTVEQQLSYDAWGNLRDPQTWSGSFTGTPMFDRGFTDHEHIYNFGLINMNGRMYDPVVSSFLSVDQYVLSPENAQGFNRYAYCMNNPLKYTDPDGEFFITFGLSLDKEHGISGFSLGLNFGLFGFGINSNWSNGFSLGAYAEVGPRIGNAGFTASIGVDYNFDYETTTASMSAGYGFSYGIGRVGIGVGGSYTWGLSSKINPWNANASVGLGLAGNISQFGQMAGFGLSCSYGTQGWNYGAHGFCEMLPLQEKLNRMVSYYQEEFLKIGETDAEIKVGSNRNLKRIDPIFGTIYDNNGEIYHDSHNNYGITVPGEAKRLFSDGDDPPLRNIGSTVYLSRNTVKKMWKGNDYFKEVMLHEYQHAVDYYTGECYKYTNSMRKHYMEYRAYWSNYQRTGLEEHFNAAAYHLKYLPIHIP